MSEREIIMLLHQLVSQPQDTDLPNAYLYSWESDYVRVTPAQYAHEYEVKRTVGDFNADFKKTTKHATLRIAMERKMSCPRSFHYVMPEAIVARCEIPDYAGLIMVVENEQGVFLRQEKKAPILKAIKLQDYQIRSVRNTARYRMWRYFGMAAYRDAELREAIPAPSTN